MPVAASLYGIAFGAGPEPERPTSPVPFKRPYRPKRPSPAPAPAPAPASAARPPSSSQPNGSTSSTPARLSSDDTATQAQFDRRAVKAAVVDSIVAEDDLYKLLNVERTASLDEIRRGFLLRSRICHPDKFPDYPLATVAFQRISFAYETLSKPSSRRLYDVTNRSDLASASSDAADAGGVQDETLNGVLRSVLHEFMEGDFEMIRVLVQALNEAPGWDLGEETVDQVEGVFQHLRTVILSGQKYLTIVRFELVRLYEIQCSLRQLSYLDVFGRLRLTLQLARVTLGIPMAIDSAMVSPDQHRPAGLGGPAPPEADRTMASGSDADSEGSGLSDDDDDDGPPTPTGIGVDLTTGAPAGAGFGIRPDTQEEARRAETKDRARARQHASHARRRAQQRQPHGHLHERPENPTTDGDMAQPWGLLGPAGRGLLGLLVTTLEVTEQWIPGSSSTSATDETA